MHVSGSEVIVVRAGLRGADHATERFAQGGAPENDLLPRNGEIDLHRVVLPGRLPETVVAALPGRTLREVVEIPRERRGHCPRRGCDHAGDTLFDIADRRILAARAVERGTLVTVETLPDDERGMYR